MENKSQLTAHAAREAVLCEALQWYAAVETYKYQSMVTFPPVMTDCGERARAALASVSARASTLNDVVKAVEKVTAGHTVDCTCPVCKNIPGVKDALSRLASSKETT